MNAAAHQYGRAARAYASATATRSWRVQEADVFRQVNFRLAAARTGTAVDRARALADNQRLWNAMSGYLHDPYNALPVGTKAGLISISHTVERCQQAAEPDFDTLIAINENIAAGLSAAG